MNIADLQLQPFVNAFFPIVEITDPTIQGFEIEHKCPEKTISTLYSVPIVAPKQIPTNADKDFTDAMLQSVGLGIQNDVITRIFSLRTALFSLDDCDIPDDPSILHLNSLLKPAYAFRTVSFRNDGRDTLPTTEAYRLRGEYLVNVIHDVSHELIKKSGFREVSKNIETITLAGLDAHRILFGAEFPHALSMDRRIVDRIIVSIQSADNDCDMDLKFGHLPIYSPNTWLDNKSPEGYSRYLPRYLPVVHLPILGIIEIET